MSDLEQTLRMIRQQGPAAALPGLLQFPADHSRAQGLLGLCYHQLGRWQEAILHLDRVPPDSPEFATSRLYAARSRLELAGQQTPPDPKLLAEAQSLFQGALQADPRDGKAWLGLAHLHHLRKDNQKALHCVEESVAADSRLNFDDLDALVFGCSIHLQAGNWKGLASLIAQLEVISVAPEERSQCALLLARLAVRLVQSRVWQQASIASDAAHRLAPQNAEVERLVASVRQAVGPRAVLAQAEGHLRQAEQAPADSGHLVEAQRLLEVSLAEGDAEVRQTAAIGLARVNRLRRDYCRALQYLEELEPLAPNSPLKLDWLSLKLQLQADRRDWKAMEESLTAFPESGGQRLMDLTVDFCRRRLFPAARRSASTFMGLMPTPEADRLLAIVIHLCNCAQQQDHIVDTEGLAYSIVELEIEGLLAFLTGAPGPGWRESEEILQRFRHLSYYQRQRCLRELRDWGNGCVTQHLLVEELHSLHDKLGGPPLPDASYAGRPDLREMVRAVRTDLPQTHSIIVFETAPDNWMKPVAISSPLMGIAAIEPVRLQGSLLGRAVQQRAAILGEDERGILPEKSVLVLPLMRGEKLLGCLYLGGPEGAFTEYDQNWLQRQQTQLVSQLAGSF